MFIKFTKPDGKARYIRAEDWRDMDDTTSPPTDPDRDRCLIGYIPERSTEMLYFVALGSADQNYERIRNDEMKAAIEYERAQRRQSQGLPSVPVQRGRGGA